MYDDIADQLDQIAGEATQLVKNLEYYWDEEGVSQLSIFIDPDLYQFIAKLYHEAHGFATRCRDLETLATRLRG